MGNRSDSIIYLDTRYKHRIPVDTEIMKIEMLEMALEAGVELMFHTFAVDTIVENNNAKGVIIENKSGRRAVVGQIIIDGTGDADVAAHAGAPYDLDPKPKGGTLIFHMANVNVRKFRPYHKAELIADFVERAIKNGDLPEPEYKKGYTPTYVKFEAGKQNVLSIAISIFDPPDDYKLSFNRI